MPPRFGCCAIPVPRCAETQGRDHYVSTAEFRGKPSDLGLDLRSRRSSDWVGHSNSWTIQGRTALLASVDTILVLGAILGLRVWTEPGWLDEGRLPEWIIALAMVWLVLAHALDCYDLTISFRVRTALPRVAVAASVSLLVYTLIPYWSPPLPSGRSQIAATLVLLLALLLLWRTAYCRFLNQPNFRTRLLMLGEDELTAVVTKLLNDTRGDYELVGTLPYADDDGSTAAPRLIEAVRASGAREVVTSGEISSSLTAALVELMEQGIVVTTAADLYEHLAERTFLSTACLSTPRMKPIVHLYMSVRRAAEVVIAALGLLIAAPLIVAAAIVIRLDSPGRVYYAQERIGRYGRPFKILKLRTMVQDAEPDGRAVWAQTSDPRITRVGALLRRSRFDEIPQLLNVLRGEMSLIGPRPERPELVDTITSAIPLYRARHAVPPGLTGWAQINYKYGASLQDAAEKLQYDLYYIRHRSPILDVEILLKTLAVVFSLRGR